MFADEDVKLIGTQMSHNVEGSLEVSISGEEKYTSMNEDVIGKKKKRGRIVDSKPKGALKKTKVDEVELGDSKDEEEAPIKWQDCELEDEMEEEFAKSARKQGMYLYIRFIVVHFKMIN